MFEVAVNNILSRLKASLSEIENSEQKVENTADRIDFFETRVILTRAIKDLSAITRDRKEVER